MLVVGLLAGCMEGSMMDERVNSLETCVDYCTRVAACSTIDETGCQNGCVAGDAAEFEGCTNENEILAHRRDCNVVEDCPMWEECEDGRPACVP